MPEQEVTIRISAKNLTAAEFKKARQEILGLGDETEDTNKKTSRMEAGFRSFGRAVPGALRVVGAALGVVTAAVGAAAGAVALLTHRGGELAAVEASFFKLAAAAGQSGDQIVEATSRASKGLVSDVEIMKNANRGLLLGLPITADSMGQLAETAIVLGRAMGQNATKSLDDLITALGRSSPLILDNLGLTVKVGEANEAYAAKVGKTVSALTEAEKKTAFYEAAMAAAQAKVSEIGGVQLQLADHVRQASVMFTNLIDRISIVLSQSPLLNAGLAAVNEQLSRLFGPGNQEAAVQVVNQIEKAALVTVEFGQAGITAAEFLTRGFAGIKVLVLGVGAALSFVAKTTAGAVATTLEAAAAVPILGKAYEEGAVNARRNAEAAAAFNESLKEQIRDAAIAAAGNDLLGRGLATARTRLEEIKLAMVNAGTSQRQLNQATNEGTTTTDNLSTAVTNLRTDLSTLPPVMIDWQGQLIQTSEASRAWAEVVSVAFGQASTAAQGFGAATRGVGDIVHAEANAMADAFHRMGLQTREELRATAEQAEKDYETILKSGQATAKQLEIAWDKLEEKRREDSDQTTESVLTAGQALFDGTQMILGALGEKYKAAAIAGAILSTYQAIAKALASAPWPFSLVLAAGAAAAGWANVNRIRASKPGFREGTPNLDFQDFGPQSLAALHGREAVIPEGSGHRLAEEIAQAQAGKASQSMDVGVLAERFDRIGAKLDELPRAIQRAVRDGVILAA